MSCEQGKTLIQERPPCRVLYLCVFLPQMVKAGLGLFAYCLCSFFNVLVFLCFWSFYVPLMRRSCAPGPFCDTVSKHVKLVFKQMARRQMHTSVYDRQHGVRSLSETTRPPPRANTGGFLYHEQIEQNGFAGSLGFRMRSSIPPKKRCEYSWEFAKQIMVGSVACAM